ncbi:unnamed protein product [Cylindrotheca closterium]|uniref:ABC1 atypical kinase-like domain-containing protein n=1 Tax=Cylindrotheca closterium TaxID=2856 RepID=A0AAD2PXS3_9STRA|nr:unnamed protein product [Cylindrotheca closterium]
MRSSQSKATLRPTVLVLLTLLTAALATAPGGFESSSRELVTAASANDRRARIGYVRSSLCDRFHYVTKGKRAKDFGRWVKTQGGEPRIFSMHGGDVNFDAGDLEKLELENDLVFVKRRKDDPFLSDRMNLNFHHDSGRSLSFYDGDTRPLIEKPATPFELYLRAVKLSLVFGPLMSTAFIATISKKFRNDIWYKWLARCLASSGAAFIKWGQWAATRSDMFSQELCDALSSLHSSAPSHSWNFTQTQVESSLDIPEGGLLEVFDTFDPEPIASGSIAQVHKARLHNGGLVAVKVRHPSVARLIDMDFRLMEMLGSVVESIPGLKWLNVKDSVSQFSHTMAAQAHLNVEAHHLEVLNHNFGSWKNVQFPKPFFASSAMIMETFETGRVCTDVLDEFDEEASSRGMPGKGHDLIPLNMAESLVTNGVSMYLKMLLVDNVMHADLHPGNIMIDVMQSKNQDIEDAKIRITLVDAGMVAQLTEEESSTFIGLLTTIGEGNGEAAAEFALQFSIDNDLSEEEKKLFKEDMRVLFDKCCKGYGTGVDVGEVLRGVLGLIRDHHVRIDSNYATLVVNVLCVESLAKRVCPTYNALDASKPLLQQYRKLCFDDDGYTPRKNGSYHKKIKKMMAFVLNRDKKSQDAAFFKNIAKQRRRDQLLGA